jgi:hypothetical protein
MMIKSHFKEYLVKALESICGSATPCSTGQFAAALIYNMQPIVLQLNHLLRRLSTLCLTKTEPLVGTAPGIPCFLEILKSSEVLAIYCFQILVSMGKVDAPILR